MESARGLRVVVLGAEPQVLNGNTGWTWGVLPYSSCVRKLSMGTQWHLKSHEWQAFRK